MLSDAERRRLTEIENELRFEDPGFAERLGRVPPRGPRERPGMTARGWLVAAALVMGLAVLLRSPGLALIAMSVAGVSAAIWLTRSAGTDGRPPPRP
ncbi:DUF3040 domain-containing protein [Actinoplanes auranticolor]|uniref:DUF3040 family protein n=1 Tax=Actinoplanes auranticolor TaxID=47988 RepID=A0A919VH50_9ACTN|nr:DUF3040 domain-containing protein [Actinoplanes auranticolor]GIM65062.1 hypothetical protein Aau02nite_14440 [Actinoplanes auranticolor]